MTEVQNNFCPYCQMPLSLIKTQVVNLHIEVCSRKKKSHVKLKECPKGLKCDSTMMCHFERFSHMLLAKKRANLNNNEVPISQFDSESVLPNTFGNHIIEYSSEDFASEISTGITPTKRKKLNKNLLKGLYKVDRVPLLKDSNLVGNTVIATETGGNDLSKCNLKSFSNCAVNSLSSVACDFAQSSKDVIKESKKEVKANKADTFATSLISDCAFECQDKDKLNENEFQKYTFSTSTQNTKSEDFLNDKVKGGNAGILNDAIPKGKCFDKSNNNLMSATKQQKQGDIGVMLFGMKPKHTEALEKQVPVEVKDHGFVNKRTCPFYKKIDGTDIAVDAFSYGLIPRINFYFLTHFHYDHYMGLNKKFQSDIYCSHVTGNLLQLRLGIAPSQIHRLPMNEKVQIGNVHVTLLEANHCPGAVLLLFNFKNGRTILHTGDFRADEKLQNQLRVMGTPVDVLYLDTTYLDPHYTFPTQDDVIRFVAEELRKIVSGCPKSLIVTGTYCIGKEKVFNGIARELGVKVCVKTDKARVLKCMDDRELDSIVTTDIHSTNLHVLPMNKLNPSSLHGYMKTFNGSYDQLVAIKPTGWTFKGTSTKLENLQPSIHGNVLIYAVPYSEHSSFSELKQFVELLKPNRVIPTVNVGKADSRSRMESYLNCWKKR